MRAAHITQPGPPEEALEIVDVDIPKPRPDEVRIEVHACGLNHKDVFARVGHPDRDPEYPLLTGTDIAGTIDAVGSDVEAWDVGDRVTLYPRLTCGDCEYCLNGEHTMCPDSMSIPYDFDGGLAEFVTFPASMVEPVPDSLDFVTAAAWPVTFTTAWRMIVTAGKLRPAETALILGASGGVGNACLQIANRLGATAYATASTPAKAEMASEWAEEVIDYTEVDFADAIQKRTGGRGVDLVADHVGQATWQTSIDSLARNGRMVICGATSGPDPDIDIRSVYQFHREIVGAPLGNRQDFRDVHRLVASGELEPQVDRVLPLGEIVEGHRLIEDRDVIGNVVIQPGR